jgi:hypothetical protein
MSSSVETAKTIFQIIDSVQNIGDAVRTRSLIDASQAARVEPLLVVSKDCMTLDYLQDINQTMLSLFTGYYMQAVSLAAKIEDVKVMSVLDKVNPDRNYRAPAFETYKDVMSLAVESYKWKLPMGIDTNVGMEAKTLMDDVHDVTSKMNKPGGDGDVSDNATKTLNEASNMAVGKMISVEINVNNCSMKIPVSVRLMPTLLSNASITHLLTLKTEDTSLVERYHAWRAGRISFISDLVFCQDMITEHKKALMEDKSGVYSEIIRRVNNSRKYGLLSMNFSLATASNLFVISEAVATEVEQKLGGKLSNPRTRDKAFEGTYAMIIAVVDREWERVTFYYRGISASTDASIKDLKAANKSKGIDVMDVLKMYNQGSAPSF